MVTVADNVALEPPTVTVWLLLLPIVVLPLTVIVGETMLAASVFVYEFDPDIIVVCSPLDPIVVLLYRPICSVLAINEVALIVVLAFTCNTPELIYAAVVLMYRLAPAITVV